MDRALYPQYSAIDHFYCAAECTIDKRLLNADKYVTKPFIPHSVVENQDYLSSLLPLLCNNTYSLIVHSEDLLLPLSSSEWIDSAIVTCESSPVHSI